jgi:hypothetical protein
MSAIIQSYNLLKSANPDDVVTVAISIDQNTTVTCEGLRSNVAVVRALAGKGGLSENVDMSVLVLCSNFESLEVVRALRGRTATITRGGDVLTMRIMGSDIYAGEVALISFGDWDRTV